MGCRIAADWMASGRPLRLVACEDGADGLAGAAGLEGAVHALRPAIGYAPLALLRRLGALEGARGLKALRARHARLNGDVMARIAADSEAAKVVPRRRLRPHPSGAQGRWPRPLG